MVLRAALILVLLQLHASDTLKEENDDIQTLPRPKATSPHQIVGSGKLLSSLHQPQRMITPQDEDLLDLMVRIAETPTEWERIHKVLSQLGAEKDNEYSRKTRFDGTVNKNKTATMFPPGNSNITTNFSEPNIYVNNTTSRIQLYSTERSIQQSETASFEVDYQSDQPRKVKTTDDIDTGWPDFEEAILKKIKTPRVSNDILERDWYEDDWLDTTWSDYLSGVKDHQTIMQESRSENPPVSFVATKTNAGISKGNLDSDNSRASKLLQFPSREVASTHSQTFIHKTSEDGFNRTSRPAFLYHRVTTSPQERKGNGAFIAVSVVKQSQLETPVTQTPVVGLHENQDSSWRQYQSQHRIQDKVRSSPGEKLQVGSELWEEALPHVKRGHRRHYTKLRGHTHDHH